jgi:8-oxo-dGTP pyrophosphatase MutT (NUDIX family)
MDAESLHHHQVAALPFRKRGGRMEILLITSRETKRWVIPKGWPMEGRTDYNAAKQEAWEEAGVKGRIGKLELGHYIYSKRLKSGEVGRCRTVVYPLEVEKMLGSWPEKKQRFRSWFAVDEAVEALNDEGLIDILTNFDP